MNFTCLLTKHITKETVIHLTLVNYNICYAYIVQVCVKQAVAVETIMYLWVLTYMQHPLNESTRSDQSDCRL